MSTAPGGPETLEMMELDTPQPGRGEVLIRVHAAGVNFPGTLMIRDLYQFKPPRPFAPGGEIAGEVEALGEGVEGLAVGDRVLALTMAGGFASHIVLDACAALRIRDAMPYADAACFIFTYGTSYYALKDRGQLKAGDTLLVLGAAGGVGAAAVEIGKAMGAKVIAAVSSEEKAAFCRELGADETVIYARDMDRDAQKAFSTAIKEAAGPGGVNVAYDAVGGDYAEPAIRAMAWDGRFLVVGFPAGIPKIPLNLTLLKSCQIVGVFWGAAVKNDPKGHAENMAALFAHYEAGRLKPRISARYPLERAGEAIEALQSRKAMGKLVVEIA